LTEKECIEEIIKLKKERNAIILAHNYQRGEIQDIADYIGDSLGLSQKAAKVKEKIIVFCGVHFMAETASILAPDKTVLIPDITAGCPMADMISAKEMKDWKSRYPGKPVVCYINSTADVKAECDFCCTSSNAIRVVEFINSNEILFAPDRYLGSYIASQINNKKLILWDGYCYVHRNILPRHILEKKQKYPEAEVWAHPECRGEVLELADKILSTGGMVRQARETDKKEIIIATEAGIIYRLKKENPNKNFYPAYEYALCANMKKITLKKVLQSLQEMKFVVKVPDEIAKKAKNAIDRMIKI
jgi:quinolinate synthase